MIVVLLRGGGGAKIHSFHNITSFDNILSAWQRFSHDKQKKQDVIEFKMNLMDNLYQLHNDLKNRTYTHGSYSHFTIADPKKRDIHKSSVRDRIVHHLLYHALYPYFDSKFIHDSYSCRINKGTHKALNRFEEFSRKCSCNNTKTCWVLKCDIRKFFASINHEILKQILRSHIDDGDTLGLLENIIDSFCTERGAHGSSLRGAPRSGEGYKNTNYPLGLRPLPLGGGDETAKYNATANTKGLPLGNLTSQLLVNIYMNKFDQFVKHELKQKYYIRYADDFVFLSESRKGLEELLPRIREFLWQELRLELHPDRVFIKTVASGVDFLGWVHFINHRVLRTSTKRRMIRNLKDNKSTESIASYKGMMSHGNAWKLQKHYLSSSLL
jgi:RNA-directed DNA polymerase